MSDCCRTTVKPGGQAPASSCPQCGREGRPVDRITVQALLKPEMRGAVNGSRYLFCETADCPVVYYAADGVQFRKDQVRVRVGLKETEDPIPVCYCFGVTERMVHEEIRRTGRSTAAIRIRAEVKAGNCRCDVENPSGRCCLGEVIRAEKQAAAESLRIGMEESMRTQQGATEQVPAVSSVGAPKPAIMATSAGGLLAAFLASVCCLGPLAFAVLGVGAGATGFLAGTAGFLKALLPYQPLFIGLTGLLLGVSFYLAYRSPRTVCVPGAACLPAVGRFSMRTLLWIVAAVAVILVLAPYWLEWLTGP